jgi:hypothetical protein
MAFHRFGQLFDAERIVRSIDISNGVVRFATAVRVTVGERIDLSLRVPKQITGDKQKHRRFTGRVAHVDPRNQNGYRAVGWVLSSFLAINARASVPAGNPRGSRTKQQGC